MTSSISMDIYFERNKNIKATVYTIAICLLIWLFFFLRQWTLPQIIPPIAEEGIEVNLGNSETGSDIEAPKAIGAPAETSPATASVQTPTNTTEALPDNEPNPINTTPITKPVITKVVTAPVIVKPKIQTPKATFGGVKSTTGGNNSDSYNGIKNQGIAGGNGDQGNPNGNPNSDSYHGNAPSGNGVQIRSGLNGRRIIRIPKMEDDFSENAKVAVDIIVDKAGKVISQSINLNGTTTNLKSIRDIALKRIKEITFNSGSEESQQGTIVFDFKVTN